MQNAMPPPPVPYGVPENLAPGLQRLIAPNPSPMTYWGTNTYLLGQEEVAVIDPGPVDAPHLQAILAAAGGPQQIAHILVTHSHRDHTPGARALSEATGVGVSAFGPSKAGQSALMARLEAAGGLEGGEGLDPDFAPDICLPDGAVIEMQDHSLTALHTPGHFNNHLSFLWQDAVFTGDHVMDWATSLVSPPDGDLAAFMTSCARLATLDARIFYPGHGNPVKDPAARLAWLIAHRETRHAEIRTALAEGPATAQDIAAMVYKDLAPALLPMATRNTLAHLIALVEEGTATAPQGLNATARFAPK